MTLKGFETLLKTCCKDVSHHKSKGGALPRIIYSETGRNYYYADDKAYRKTWDVGVHLFADPRHDCEGIIEALEGMFDEYMITFDMEEINYGSIPADTADPAQDGVIHYHYKCEV